MCSDARYNIEDLIADGGKVAVRWRLDATDVKVDVTGVSGKEIVMIGITIQRVASYLLELKHRSNAD
jgi:predicted ester cyclase